VVLLLAKEKKKSKIADEKERGTTKAFLDVVGFICSLSLRYLVFELR